MMKLTLQRVVWRILIEAILYQQMAGSTFKRAFTFEPDTTNLSYFRDLLIDGDTVVVGARNAIYQLHVENLRKKANFTWTPDYYKTEVCKLKGGSTSSCQNHIRVLLKNNENRLIACGTNAMEPECRTLELRSFSQVGVATQGLGLCPMTPDQNSTAVYAGNSVYSGISLTSIDSLIYKQSADLRTEHYNWHALNKPDFITSFEDGDKVYFVFRELAVEYRNCGKRIYSRISRLCKTDTGGTFYNEKTFMSFFKARLTCYVQGDFPFYFDEVRSMSAIGLGNVYGASSSTAERMFYAVFTTPRNAIQMSAVCAYKWQDVLDAFDGRFKEQKIPHGVWLPVSYNKMTHARHPTKCVDKTKLLSLHAQQFNKEHPIMDEPVPPYACGSIFVGTSLNRTFTHIVIDFRVEAADGKFYDVLFIGMSDGTVRKAYNRGHGGDIDTVIVEDIPAFRDGLPIENMKLHKKNGRVSIIVASKKQIKKFSASDCCAHSSCTKCVGSKDVYCSWNRSRKKCEKSTKGLQSLVTGHHRLCTPYMTTTDNGTDVMQEFVKESKFIPSAAPRLPTSTIATILTAFNLWLV